MANALDIHPAVRIAYNLPDLASFKRLRAQTNWGVPDNAAITTALNNSVFGAVAIDEMETIGMIRVVGDGAMNVYVQDVIVDENYRGLGIGRRLVQTAIHWMHDMLPSSITVGLMAAIGQESFYEPFGFTSRVGPRFGPGMQSQLSDLTVSHNSLSIGIGSPLAVTGQSS
jgi:GNAT superfamily N-acetyltransferase